MSGQGGHFDTDGAWERFVDKGPSAIPTALVALSPLDDEGSSLRILTNWTRGVVPTAEDFDETAAIINIPKDHTLFMSDHMPHGGWTQVGRRAHALIAGPSFVNSVKIETHWLRKRPTPSVSPGK